MLGLWVCKLRSLATKHGSRTRQAAIVTISILRHMNIPRLVIINSQIEKTPPAPAAASAWRRRSGDGSGKEGADGIVGDGSRKHDAIGTSINEISTF